MFRNLPVSVKRVLCQGLSTGAMTAKGMAGDRRFGVYHPARVKNRSPAGWSPKVNYLQMVFEAFWALCLPMERRWNDLISNSRGRDYGPYDLTTDTGRAGLAAQIRAFNHLDDQGPLEIVEGVEQNLTDRNVPCITLANPAS